jgi:hypothetical protein
MRDQGGLSVLKRRIEVTWTRQVQNDNVMYSSVMPYRHGYSCFSHQVILSHSVGSLETGLGVYSLFQPRHQICQFFRSDSMSPTFTTIVLEYDPFLDTTPVFEWVDIHSEFFDELQGSVGDYHQRQDPD